MDAILKENTDKDYLIIDLINNGGGALDSVVAICDLFLPSKQLVATIETKNKDQTKYQTKDKDAYTYDHIFLLMNENTASASEILIGCLGYHLPNLTIIGTNTYGKGIAQRTSDYCKKGDLVGIKGRVETYNYDTEHGRKYITEVIVEKITFLSSKK